MKIHLVSLEDGITATGFRKFAAYAEKINPDTRTFYVGTQRYRSMWKSFARKVGEGRSFGAAEVEEIAHELAAADVVAFSSMTGYADLTKELATRVRALNPKAYTMWGGIHPIIYPEDAIKAEVDAICTGEGELAFAEWLHHFENGSDASKTSSFWFKDRASGEIKRNPFRPLMSSAELASLPYPKYGGAEGIYEPRKGFRPVTRGDYLGNNGLAYPAVWSIGCPLHCTYCGNTVFIANDANYRKIRHSGVDYIIGEVQAALKVHPYLKTVLFYDDSFMAISLRELTEFSTRWREEVGIEFCIYGVIPTYVQRDKVEILTWAGMNRVRMGIQSGSERILKFYKRPTPVARIEQAAAALAEFADYQINPSYDIIVDNPVETRQDVIDTLELIYRLKKPFTLNIFSLRVIPNTSLEQQMIAEGFDVEQINENYTALRPTWANVLLYVLMVWTPPRKLFDRWLRGVRAYHEPQKSYPILILLARIPWLIQQGLRHLKHGEFSVITGYPGYILWRTGALKLVKKLFSRKLVLPEEKWTGRIAPDAAA
jgi:anaerobic magnesium-protoporphyrin IX monomethyl ester cyclase